MLWTPQTGDIRVQHNSPALATATPGTAVTTGASASTKGAVAQIFAATNFDVWGITLIVTDYGDSNTASAAVLDVLIGPAGSEQVLIPDLLVGSSPVSTNMGAQRFDFPLFIPAGTRVAARAAGQRVNTAMQVQVVLRGGGDSPPWRVGRSVTAYGITAIPDGTVIVAGNATEGSWTQITAATARDHFFLVPAFQLHNDTGVAGRALVIDYGVGAAASEVELGSMGVGTSNLEMLSFSGDVSARPIYLPAGSRLAMRASAHNSPDDYNGALYGIS